MPKTSIGHQWYNFPAQPYCFSFWDDFDDEYALTSNLPVAASSPWIGTALSSGTFAQSTDAAFGKCVLASNGAADNSGAQIQTDFEFITLAPAGEVWFTSKLSCSTATADAWFAGISITDTTLVTATAGIVIAALSGSDCIGFFSPNDEANVYLAVNKDGAVQIMAPVGTYSAGTEAVWSFKIVMDASVAGKGSIFAAKDGTWVGDGPVVQSTNLPDSGESANEMGVSLAYVSGAAAGGNITVDYVGALQTR